MHTCDYTDPRILQYSVEQGKQAADEIRGTNRGSKDSRAGRGVLEVMHLDLTDMGSVRTFAQRILSLRRSVRVLCNNAGILKWQGWTCTSAGFEEHLHANHLGHFLLVFSQPAIFPPFFSPSAPHLFVTISSIRGCVCLFRM
jgi:NAD(P)-dependent dehydrogenase (short-subunit alcohol dehydrogenase family)